VNRRRRITTVGLALALSASPAAQPFPQNQTELPRFRGGVELVQLDVSVLDRDRRPVTGLTAADFTVLENGRERPVRAFTPVRLPPRTADPAPTGVSTIKPDVATNQRANQDGRLVFILMDRTIPAGEPTLTAKKIAIAAIESLGPSDLAALLTTGQGTPQGLTANRQRLIAAVNESDWSTNLSKDQDNITRELPLVGKDDPLGDGRCLCGLCVLETLTRIADAARSAARQRKLLLFIGSGLILQVPYQDPKKRPPSKDVECTRRVTDAQRAAFGSLALSNLTIHSFDPNGLANVGSHVRAATPNKMNQSASTDRLKRFQEDTADHLDNQNSLRVLPELTGGRAILNTSAPERDVKAIFDESESYYVLAFEQATPTREGETRKIEVRVRRDGVRVHSQRQHASSQALSVATSSTPAPNVPAPLLRALQSLLPTPDRPLTMALAAFAGTGSAKQRVAINVDVSAFVVPDATPVPLDIAVAALDRFGRQVMTARQTSTISVRPGLFGDVVDTIVPTHLELEPGDYEIRLGVSDQGRGSTASVYSEITVPRFGSAPLSLSDVTFEVSGRGASATPNATTRRAFARDEQARAIVHVYQGTQLRDPLRPVEVRVRIAAAGRTVRDQVTRLNEGEFIDRRASVVADINALRTGDYILAFGASMPDRTSERTVGFSVK
jgi:VWFA-related protein